jgi:hypothetical protein
MQGTVHCCQSNISINNLSLCYIIGKGHWRHSASATKVSEKRYVAIFLIELNQMNFALEIIISVPEHNSSLHIAPLFMGCWPVLWKSTSQFNLDCRCPRVTYSTATPCFWWLAARWRLTWIGTKNKKSLPIRRTKCWQHLLTRLLSTSFSRRIQWFVAHAIHNYSNF